MKGYLLDTSIISLFAPDRPQVSSEFAAWIESEGEKGTLFLSAVSVAEIEKGIQNLRRKGASARPEKLNLWLETLIEIFADRILSVDVSVARASGVIEDRVSAKGKHPGLGDVLIAATAGAHQLTILTDNTKHFSPLGVTHLTPQEALQAIH